MNPELLKSFENVINFYKTKPKYLDIVGTEIYEKMYALEKQIFEVGGCKENSCGGFEIHDRDIYKCALCGNYFSDGVDPNHEYYFAEQGINCEPDEDILELMFPNEDEYNRMIAFQDVHNLWNFCHNCSVKYGYVCHGGYWEIKNNDSKNQMPKDTTDKKFEYVIVDSPEEYDEFDGYYSSEGYGYEYFDESEEI